MSAFSERLGRVLAGRRGPLAIAALGLLALFALARGPGSADQPEPVPVKREDLVLDVEMEGELAAVRSAEIGAPPVNEWEFKISFMAPEGSEVKKGDPVLGFDTQGLERLLDQKRAELKEASGKLEQKALELLMKTLEGGVLGIVAGVAIAKGVAAYAGWKTIVTLASILVSVGVSAAVGLLFGIYPALRAARLDPIEALRYE